MSSTKIILAAVVAVLAVGGVSAVVMNSNKPIVVDKLMSKSSEIMMKKDEAMMKKTRTSAEIESMKKDEAMAMGEMSFEEKAAFEKLSPDQQEMFMMQKENMMKDGVTMDSVIKKGEPSTKKAGYIDYSIENLAANSTGKNIIFFKASWCPTCKAVDADITANEAKIPDGVNIMKVDYDTSTELKKKYGVTQQHTFVVIDKDGNKITSNQGAPTLDAILALVK